MFVKRIYKYKGIIILKILSYLNIIHLEIQINLKY